MKTNLTRRRAVAGMAALLVLATTGVAVAALHGEADYRLISIPAASFAGIAVKLRIANEGIIRGSKYIDDRAALSAQRDAERLAGCGQ